MSWYLKEILIDTKIRICQWKDICEGIEFWYASQENNNQDWRAFPSSKAGDKIGKVKYDE